LFSVTSSITESVALCEIKLFQWISISPNIPAYYARLYKDTIKQRFKYKIKIVLCGKVVQKVHIYYFEMQNMEFSEEQVQNILFL